MKHIKSVLLDKNVENRLFTLMNRDRISHFYSIYDLKHLREKTLAWVALLNNKPLGYMIEFDKRILTIRGSRQGVIPLLKNSNLTTPMFNIEPHHLSAIKRLYKPVEPADKMTIGKITTFTTMKTTPQSCKPIIKHKVQEITKENAPALANLLDIEPQTALGYLTGFAFGIFKLDKLVSFAASPEMLEDLAIIRGVQTMPEERNKGYATSVCSALIQRLHQQGKDVMLYVSKDNPAAIKVYKKIGFKTTGHVFLGFKAKRKQKLD